MRILNSEILNKAIISVFKNKADFFLERRDLADLIIKDHNEFFKEIRARRKREFESLPEQIKLNKLSISDALKKLHEFNDSYAEEKKSLVNNNGIELLKQYNDIYAVKTKIKNFINEPALSLEPAPAEYKELVRYEKEYPSGRFVVTFFSNENNNLQDIGVSVRQKNGHVLNSIINLGLNKKEMVLSSFNIAHKNMHLELNSRNEFANTFLNSLKEEDLLTLDSEEKEVFFSMLFDYKLDLKNDPLYEVFKIGLNDFINIVKNELKQKTNNKLKGI